MNEGNYLALDLGAESGRAMVGTIKNGKLTLTETHRFANRPVTRSTGLHWDVSALWGEIKRGIGISARQFRLESLALDTWGVDFALLDAGGDLLGTPYHYRDTRTDGMLTEAFRRVPREQIFAQTGIQFMQINSLYQLLAMVIAKDPQLRDAHTFLTIPDLFNHWLCGSLTCEFTNATTTQCFNPFSRSWALPLMEALGIPTGMFPAVSEPGSRLGVLLPDVALATGTGSLQVIAPACHDTGSAVVAVPAENQDFAWLSSGTWSILGAEVRQPEVSPQALAYNFTNEGGVFGTWRLSKNIMGLWLIQECRRAWQRQGQDHTYNELTRLASEAAPFLAVVNPDDDLFFHPGDMPVKIQSYCQQTGQRVPQTKGEVLRVALESLALKYCWVLARLEELTGKQFSPVHIIGGGTQNRLLNQFTADATRRTVVTGPIEATAIGNLLMQAIGMGHLDTLADAREIVRNSFDVEEYHPGNRDGWDEAYVILLKLMENQE